MVISAAGKKELRKFAYTVATGFAIFALVGLLRHRMTFSGVCAAVCIVLVTLALLAPALLRPIQKGWLRIGGVLGYVNMRILLSLIFYAVLTPIGWLRRIAGNDPLQRRFDKKALSYWIETTTETSDLTRYKRQF